MKKLEGKRALVAGAARGIGRAIAERFTAEGAIVLLADIDGEEVARVAQTLLQTSRTVDVSRKAQIDASILTDPQAEHRVLSRTPLGRLGLSYTVLVLERT